MLSRFLWILAATATVACSPQAPEGAAPSGRSEPGSARAAETDPPSAASGALPDDPRPRLVFLGTSLTAGQGVPPERAFPARIQERVDRAALPYRVVNAGVSGDTSAGGRRRIEWLLREPIAVLVVELGANDMLRGQDPGALRENLQQIIDRARAESPGVQIVIAGMRAAPNLGQRYAERFESSFAELARENGLPLIPFLLEGVAAIPELNQPDGIHPTAEGHARIADTVWEVLGPLLQRRDARVAAPSRSGARTAPDQVHRGEQEQRVRRPERP